MSNNGIQIISSPIRKIEEKIILDIRTFLPCVPKEVEEWNWKKVKHEKWVVHMKKNGKFSKWKINEDK